MKILLTVILLIAFACNSKKEQEVSKTHGYNEPHRPQFHFSPKANWMNDPNGLVYYNGTYHLFFQYYPDSTVWGPMHWGHATSTDLIHWKETDIALYPDSLGYIFSGSAVVDHNNTSGFGQDGKPPLVAIYTYHDTTGISTGRIDYQTQGIAYSNDDGKTWTKYSGNPVLPNPGIIDFRDPKVSWHAAYNKWIMALAVKDRIHFYSSPDLKKWTKESEFGEGRGAHGGVWECPDLFSFVQGSDTTWVLLVSINPGGPNTGSATQYFVGKFDGKTFTSDQKDIKWLDYGPDNYAGVTWSNVGDRKLFIGWMSNWQYGQQVPTSPWRSAMTIPRELLLHTIAGQTYVVSKPAKELSKLDGEANKFDSVESLNGPTRIQLLSENVSDLNITLSNTKGEKIMIGYNKAENKFFIDRMHSGKVDFEKTFGSRYTAPRISNADHIELDLYIDAASVELFGDKGLTCMTAVFFPNESFNKITVEGATRSIWKTNLSSIW